MKRGRFLRQKCTTREALVGQAQRASRASLVGFTHSKRGTKPLGTPLITWGQTEDDPALADATWAVKPTKEKCPRGLP
jgi:hypothetical protein